MPAKKTRKRSLSTQEFKQIYSKVPRLTVEAVITTAKGVLLLKRQESSWHGQWHIPGGTVLYREPVLGAVQRIAQEETGLKVTVGKLLGYIEYPSEVKERGFGSSVGLAFECQPAELEPIAQLAKMDKDKLQWFKKLPKKLVQEQRQILEKVMSLDW